MSVADDGRARTLPAVRPEGLALVSPDEPQALPGRVVDRRYAGPLTYYTVALARGDEAEVLSGPDAASEGDQVGVAPRLDELRPWLFRFDGDRVED